jgi:hypothetical protein
LTTRDEEVISLDMSLGSKRRALGKQPSPLAEGSQEAELDTYGGLAPDSEHASHEEQGKH